MQFSLKRLGILGATLTILVQVGHAQTATTTLPITATVLKVCTVTATPMAFGNYTASGGTATTSTATLAVLCTSGTTYELAMDPGQSSGATTSTRKMSFLTSSLSYGLYHDSAHTQNWGNNSGVDTGSGTGTGALASVTVYGSIATGQYAPVGAYTDTVTVTVSF